VVVEVGDDLGSGRRRVRVSGDISGTGEVPLPPYIHEPLRDQERYQTVYARRSVSSAAPTAGLHLTTELLDRCRAAGALIAPLELAVGLGTFRPVPTATVAEHAMHAEAYNIPTTTMEACASADRVVAIGTTVVRALEAAAITGALEGRTDLFIQRGFEFKVVDALLTNFHVPRTTLLALVDAFVGPRWRDLYAEALAAGYRFLSFGDAMLVERSRS
jgi:S-adenosylmethionine:tRNA ribosyltransferase-isomerase